MVTPIKSKNMVDVTTGILEGMRRMGSRPKLMYSDDEGTLQTAEMQEFFKDQKIQHYRTRSHPHFVERFNRTFKDMLSRGLMLISKRVRIIYNGLTIWMRFY